MLRTPSYWLLALSSTEAGGKSKFLLAALVRNDNIVKMFDAKAENRDPDVRSQT